MRSPQLQLALTLYVVGIAGCQLFEQTGSACLSDANCPSPQICCAGSCESQCSGVEAAVVRALLSTDFVPRYEFDEVVVDFDGKTQSFPMDVVTEIIIPRPLVELTDVRFGAHTLTMTLESNGASVATQTVSLDVTDDTAVTVIIARGSGTSCQFDSDCTSSAFCCEGICSAGLCFERRDDALCGVDQRCLPTQDCVSAQHECDTEADCSDGIVCTRDRCEDGRCFADRDDSPCPGTICEPSYYQADPNTGCTPVPCNSDTCVAAPCESATCVDGHCLRAARCSADEHCCNGVCAADCSNERACAGRPAGTVCRDARGICDVAEVCDGTTEQCPADMMVVSGTTCRVATDVCDVAEACTGRDALCPVDTFAPNTVVCRAAGGVCDIAETCTGTGPACPADARAHGVCKAQTECRSAAVCNGGLTCPVGTPRTGACSGSSCSYCSGGTCIHQSCK